MVEQKVSKKNYFYGLGRRKSSVSRVRLHPAGTGKVTINDRVFEEYVPSQLLRSAMLQPLDLVGMMSSYDITIIVNGGGFKTQVDASRLGIAKALVDSDEAFKAIMRKNGLLTTDARIKERKKPGLVKARKAKQYTKR